MKNKKIYIPIIIIAIAIIFFSYAPVITFDTSHYLWLVNMLSPNAAFADWDIARGLVFPLMIYASTIIFGAGSDGILVTMFIMYITMISFVYLTFKKAIKVLLHIFLHFVFFFLISTCSEKLLFHFDNVYQREWKQYVFCFTLTCKNICIFFA